MESQNWVDLCLLWLRCSTIISWVCFPACISALLPVWSIWSCNSPRPRGENDCTYNRLKPFSNSSINDLRVTMKALLNYHGSRGVKLCTPKTHHSCKASWRAASKCDDATGFAGHTINTYGSANVKGGPLEGEGWHWHPSCFFRSGATGWCFFFPEKSYRFEETWQTYFCWEVLERNFWSHTMQIWPKKARNMHMASPTSAKCYDVAVRTKLIEHIATTSIVQSRWDREDCGCFGQLLR